ncbi:MAG: hypothetical protein GEU79_07715 [Acidimicrobiia bacterium]|nr:hypothetical protein [Acidimicrobiia bacterium]
MKITQIDAYPIVVPLVTPVVMANQIADRSQNVLVRIRTDEGLVGWGEGVAAPEVTGETQGEIVDAIDVVGEMLMGADPLRHSTLWRAMRRWTPSSTAVGAIDIALHDLAGKALGVPIAELIGGRHRDRIPALRLVGSGRPEQDLAVLASLQEEGFSWFKLKLALNDIETEAKTLREAVELAGDSGVICGDANEGWDDETALRMLKGLEGSGVRFIEQPVSRDDPEALADLASLSPIPLCADESARTLEDVKVMASMGMGGVSLKLIKHGGITGVMRGARICGDRGLAINLAGKVAETSIAATANLHCAAAMTANYYGCSPANLGLVSDVVSEAPRLVDGDFIVPDGPGLGIEVDENLVKEMSEV